LEAERTRVALVGDVAGGVDQVNPVRPGGVLLLGGVAKFVQHGGKFYSQFSHAGAGEQGSLFFAPGTGEHYLIFNIALHLPDVTGVRFRDVDHQKGGSTAVLFVKLVEGRNLPPEGRSGVASEYKDYRLSVGAKF
jgi:hypothetical protein